MEITGLLCRITTKYSPRPPRFSGKFESSVRRKNERDRDNRQVKLTSGGFWANICICLTNDQTTSTNTKNGKIINLILVTLQEEKYQAGSIPQADQNFLVYPS